MSFYPNDRPEPSQQRSPWLITVVLVGLVLAVVLALWQFYLGGIGLRIAPTATPTATPAAPATATPDFRATLIAEDRATQIAFQAVMTMQTPETSFLPGVQFGEHDTPTPSNVNLVPVGSGAEAGAATATLIAPPVADTPTPLPPPNVVLTPPAEGVNPESPLLLPGVGGSEGNPENTPDNVPVVIESATLTPSETPLPPTETPTPPPTFTFTPSPTVFQVETLRAEIRPTLATPVELRLAPMNTFTPVSTLLPGTEIRLIGRDSTGEWVYICCVNNEPRWIRQAYAPPLNNTLPDNAPPSATPNDVRWLPTRPWPGNYPQPAAATPIPANDFPRFRRDINNSGHVPLGYNGLLAAQWPLPARVPQRWTTAVMVVDQFVLAASADTNLYGLDRSLGNQIWSFPLGAQVTHPLNIVEGRVYFADDSGRAFALPLGAGTATWQNRLEVPGVTTSALPATGFIALRDRLYIGVKSGDKYYLVQHAREGGAALRYFDLGATPPQELAIGNQLLYVAGGQIWALDIDDLELVWSRNDLRDHSAPPVYTSNGVTRLSELYVATGDGKVHELDATTGDELHTYEGTEYVSGLAVGENLVFATGNAFMKAFDRRNDSLVWRIATNGDTAGGALVTPDQLILVSATGVIQFINPVDGRLSVGGAVPTSVLNMAAVSGTFLFIPGEDGGLYAFAQ